MLLVFVWSRLGQFVEDVWTEGRVEIMTRFLNWAVGTLSAVEGVRLRGCCQTDCGLKECARPTVQHWLSVQVLTVRAAVRTRTLTTVLLASWSSLS